MNASELYMNQEEGDLDPNRGSSSGKEALAEPELEQAQIDAIVQRLPGGIDNLQAIYPLSPLQEGMLFHHLMDEESDTYVLSVLFELEAHTRPRELVRALQMVVNRHGSLRSAVAWENLPRAQLVVCRHVMLPVQEELLDPDRDSVEQLKAHMSRPLERFDMRAAPLLRLQTYSGAHEDKSYAILRVHHIVCDHRSLSTLVEEAMELLHGRALELRTSADYRDYASWGSSRAREQDAEVFFRRQLGGIEETTAPFGYRQLHQRSTQVFEEQRRIEEGLSENVRRKARSVGVSPARLFHAAWGLVVALTSGRDDIVFGSVLLSVQHKGARDPRSIGMFVNTLPLRLRLKGVSAAELVEQTDRELRELRQHDTAPLTLAARCSGLPQGMPLFTSLMNYRRSERAIESMSAVGVRVLARSDAWTNYPLTIMIDDFGDGFAVTAKTDGRIDPLRILGYMNVALERLLECLEHAAQTPVLALSVLPEEERRQVTQSFNATQSDYPKERLIHQLFEEQVERSPHEVAVTFEERSLTYLGLNRRANQLARYLRRRGAGPGELVGLCVERDIDMLVGALGVMKAGAAYIPMDPSNPIERQQHVLGDSDAKVLLTQQRLRGTLPSCSAEVIALDAQWREVEDEGVENLDIQSLNSRHLAYVIYTSGSTGSPKGVMVQHRNIVNYAIHAARSFDVAAGDGSLVTTSFSFDLMLTGLYPVLLCGRTVHLCSQSQGVPSLVDSLLRLKNLAPLKLTPSHLALLEEPLRAGQLTGRVRTLVLGGEQLHGKVVNAWREHAPGTRIFNHYGPTETTVGCIAGEVSNRAAASVPLGRPISNTQIYILNDFRQPVPIGVVGEIYVGGAGVARGYLNRPELTSERFLSDPFSDDPLARLYRTGDLGRWREDGTIECLGRIDMQVKIRGYRIELGEIEVQILRHKHVKEVAAVTFGDGDEKRLVAYVVTEGHVESLAKDLVAHLKPLLPDYMIPTWFVPVDRLPLTANGKLDRAALPPPSMAGLPRPNYERPVGEAEQTLASIWQSLLHVDQVGRYDSFFELGGHSLVIVHMLDSVRACGLSLDARQVFETPTLVELARTLRKDTSTRQGDTHGIPDGSDVITPQMLNLVKLTQAQIDAVVRTVPGGAVNVRDIYPLTPLQDGILFHHLLRTDGQADTYVVLRVLSVPSRERLNQLIAAFQAVVDRHDILRTAILWEDLPRPIQVVYQKATLPVDEVEHRCHGDISSEIDAWMTPERLHLDLRRAPLLRLEIGKGQNGRWYALLKTHHIVLDHMAFSAAIEEVMAHLDGRADLLPNPAPFRDHVSNALEYTRTHDQEQYFRSKLGDIEEPTAPFGCLDVRGDGTRLDQAHESMERTLGERIRTQTRRIGVSAATLFHAACALVIGHACNRTDVVFGTVLLGRFNGHIQSKALLGLSINTLPIRLCLHAQSAEELVHATQRELIELLDHEQASLAVAQRCSAINGAMPLFTTLLNYRHSASGLDTLWSPAIDIQAVHIEGRTNYPITISIDDLGEDYVLTVQTDARIEARRVLDYMLTAIGSLVDALRDAPQTQALRLQAMPGLERTQVIEAFNATREEYRQGVLVHELFERQVMSTPTAVAISYNGRTLTYEELNSRSNQLARYLRTKGLGPDRLAGVCLERGVDMVVGVLATLKAGGAYVPIDASYPIERIQHMLEDAKPSLVLTMEKLAPIFRKTKAEVVLVDDQVGVDGSNRENISANEIGQDVEHLVYVIYTSGSTGLPKGTAMPHRSMLNLIEWHRRAFRGCESHRVLQFASLSFDVAFQEVFTTLCTGGTLVLVDEWIRKDAAALLELLRRESIQRLFLPPLMLQALAECVLDDRALAGMVLEDVITAGEQLRISSDLHRLFGYLKGCRLHNHYGPTETHVVTSLTLSGSVDEWPEYPSIGKPIANSQIFVLDRQGNPVSIGVIGEIYIGGENLARGYYRRPELTAQRFVADQFGTSKRLYKTGDLGRWRPDGSVEYLGRNDEQVKIRGYRVELGEVQAQLARLPQVREAAVVVREDVPRDRRIVAYVTGCGANVLNVNGLRDQLRAVLPEFMIPSGFVILDALPLTSNGKLDRRALPPPLELADVENEAHQAPQGELEQEVAQIWQDVLGINGIGRQDNFFDLGGHSLLATRVITRVSHVLGVHLPLRILFERPTIEGLSVAILEKIGAEVSPEAQ